MSVATPGEDVYLDSSTVSRSITRRQRRQLRESPAASDGGGDDQHQRHHRRHHGEPHGQPERGRRAAASPTPRAPGAAAQGQVLVTITGGSIITIASGATSGTVGAALRPARTCIWTAAR
ncbi:MAG: hypothetical protein IPN05_19905 [Sulfuritalea sp.]|nr:hypothetical protein [Sulfuritalea sp.]